VAESEDRQKSLWRLPGRGSRRESRSCVTSSTSGRPGPTDMRSIGCAANSWPQPSVPRLALLTEVTGRNMAVTIAAVATTAERRTYIP
jgi:hypothetical protein